MRVGRGGARQWVAGGLLFAVFASGAAIGESGPAYWGERQANIVAAVAQQEAPAIARANDVWSAAELGYQETFSSERLQRDLVTAGFRISEGSAEVPTDFVASFGRGTPVIGILAEFDALPGMSQAAVPVREAVTEGAPGHACGHHLFGSASVSAAIAVAQWLEASGAAGTVRVYGTPAEEGGSGKVYMTRAGLFDDVDVVLHWHPGDRNRAAPESSTSNKSGRFVFTGKAAHAAAAPDKGRSALDGVEAMNYMANLMREHMPSDARMHYVITDGGEAPNIVPERAEVYYYVRHPDIEMVKELFDRLVAAAQGAAMGTETSMSVEVMHGNFALLPNVALAGRIDANMRAIGGIEYDAAEEVFAQTIYQTLTRPSLAIGTQRGIRPPTFVQKMGSTDVGDVSWTVPTAGFATATWVPGTPAHSWQAVAAGGMSIGHKGMMLAAKVLAVTAQDLFIDAELIAAARAEFDSRRGPQFRYEALLGDRKPPLDYRR